MEDVVHPDRAAVDADAQRLDDLEQLLLGLVLGRHVDHEPLDAQRPVGQLGAREDVLGEPPRVAVAIHHAVLDRARLQLAHP